MEKSQKWKSHFWNLKDVGKVLVRLECGKFQWPRAKDEAKELTPQQYRWLIEGLAVEQPKAHKPVTGFNML